MDKCKYKCENGNCTKWRKSSVCEPSTKDWCDETPEIIEVDQMCKQSSIFGNSYYYITEDQIEALRNGKALYMDDGEYGTFIILKEAKDE